MAALLILPAVFIIVLMSLLLIKGTKESAFVNGIIVAVKIAVVLTFIILGWKYINTDNYNPYIPDNTGKFGDFGFSGIIRAAAIVFFAYIGFDAVSTAAQEAKNPKRDMPIGILGSLAICTILYILFAHVMTGVTSYTSFAGKDGIAPVAVAIDHMGQCRCSRCYSTRLSLAKPGYCGSHSFRLFISNPGNVDGTKPCILQYE